MTDDSMLEVVNDLLQRVVQLEDQVSHVTAECVAHLEAVLQRTPGASWTRLVRDERGFAVAAVKVDPLAQNVPA